MATKPSRPVLSDPFYREIQLPVLRNSWRNKGIRQTAGPVRSLFNKVAPIETVITDATLAHPTAYWRKVPKGIFRGETKSFFLKREAHVITIGNFKSMTKPGLTPAQLKECGKMIVHHEVRHGLHTDAPLANILAACRDHKIPFRLWNLFEDIRIENIARKETPGFKWGHDRFVEVPEKTGDPCAFLQSKRFTDDRTAAVWEGPGTTARGASSLDRLLTYFRQAADAEHTLDLCPIIKEFLLDFPPAKGPRGPLADGIIGGEADPGDPDPDSSKEFPDAGGGEGAGEGSAGAKPSEAEPGAGEEKPELDRKVGNAGGGGKARDAGRGDGRAGGTSKELEDTSTANSPRVPLDHYQTSGVNESYTPSPEAGRLTAILGQLIERGEQQRADYGLNGKLVAAKAGAGEGQAFLRRTLVSGKRKVTILLDCSGSMARTLQTTFRPFLVALHRLHKRRVLEVRLVLTGGTAHHVLDLDKITEEGITRIQAGHGCETVRDTLIAVDRYVRQSDVVAIFTDGDLTDGHVDAGEWRKRGVDLVGVCPYDGLEFWKTGGRSAEPDKNAKTCLELARSALTRHFRKGIVADNPFDLARQFVAHIIRHYPAEA